MSAGRYWTRLNRFFTMAASWPGVVHEPANNPVEVDEQIFGKFGNPPARCDPCGGTASLWC